MVAVISFIVIIVLVGTVAIPFFLFKKRKEVPELSVYRDFLVKREIIYHEINTTELEYSLGLIPWNEYQSRVQDARVRVARIFYEQETAIPTISRIDDQIEEQIENEIKNLAE